MRKLRALCTSAWAVLCKDTMPVWMTFAVGILTAGLTYCVVPSLNYRLEMDKVRVSYLTENIKELNSDTRRLFQDIELLTSQILDEQPVSKSLRREILSQITRLQWRNVDLAVIFADSAEQDAISRYRISLTGLRAAIEPLDRMEDLPKLFLAASDFSHASTGILTKLYKMAGLSVAKDAFPTLGSPSRK